MIAAAPHTSDDGDDQSIATTVGQAMIAGALIGAALALLRAIVSRSVDDSRRPKAYRPFRQATPFRAAAQTPAAARAAAAQVLGVDVDATDREIRSAYRKRARVAHPDHGGTAAQMIRLTEARAILLNRSLH